MVVKPDNDHNYEPKIMRRQQYGPILPQPVLRALKKFGQDIRLARLKRGLSVEMMIDRLQVSPGTYRKIEQGLPGVNLGAYAAALYALGFGNVFEDIIDETKDETGLMLDRDRIPKRVRTKKEPQGL